jgi:hypothetical protein
VYVVWTDRFVNDSAQNSISAVVAQPWRGRRSSLRLDEEDTRKVGREVRLLLETLKNGKTLPDSQACLFDFATARKQALDPPCRTRRGIRSDDFTIFGLTLSRRFAEL